MTSYLTTPHQRHPSQNINNSFNSANTSHKVFETKMFNGLFSAIARCLPFSQMNSYTVICAITLLHHHHKSKEYFNGANGYHVVNLQFNLIVALLAG